MLLDDLCSWFISQANENVIKSLALQTSKELAQIDKSQLEFDCISGADEETGDLNWENMTIAEIEQFAEEEHQN